MEFLIRNESIARSSYASYLQTLKKSHGLRCIWPKSWAMTHRSRAPAYAIAILALQTALSPDLEAQRWAYMLKSDGLPALQQ